MHRRPLSSRLTWLEKAMGMFAGLGSTALGLGVLLLDWPRPFPGTLIVGVGLLIFWLYCRQKAVAEEDDHFVVSSWIRDERIPVAALTGYKMINTRHGTAVLRFGRRNVHFKCALDEPGLTARLEPHLERNRANSNSL